MMKLAETWGFVVFPCSIIVVFTGMNENSTFMELVLYEISIIIGTRRKIYLSLPL